MNNKEFLEIHKKKYGSKPHFSSGYFGLSESNYFGTNHGNSIIQNINEPHPHSFETMVNSFKTISLKVHDKSEVVKKHLENIGHTLRNKAKDTIFINAFNSYLESRIEVDFNKTTYTEPEIYEVYYGVELARYKVFLEESVFEDKEEKLKKELSLPKQILLLEKLGVLDFLRNKSISGESLNELLNRITGKSKDNIKKELNKKLTERLKNSQTREYLEKLGQDFTKMGLIDEAKQIKKDLDK
ncbi:MAG: hypothetical protein CFE21_00010 [Bacteroidetes bacterium B1(2017)]|nr:MAG: hypothetical protein CFE21_00010 [Bacteroidetes bacterium B1(2017)]